MDAPETIQTDRRDARGNLTAVRAIEERWTQLLTEAMRLGWWGEVRVRIAVQDGILQLESFDGHADRRVA
jgi:hypothetical protein